MEPSYKIPQLPLPYDLETKRILKQLNISNKKLAELKGVALTIPNENILISTLTLQEAKDSSAVENIITTHDTLYKADLNIKKIDIPPAAKEVQNYREAIQTGFTLVRNKKILNNNIIIKVQEALEHNQAGFRKVPGTELRRNDNTTVYIPPQNGEDIKKYMDNLEKFINDDTLCDYDPLIKMAIIHHQFESIHPFYDGNGRTGRIINVLYLVLTGLLDLPILYLSRYITHNKNEYYKLLQAIRNNHEDNSAEWENWILFMLKGIEVTSEDTIQLIKQISNLMQEYKNILRPIFKKQYNHELLNNLFYYPYTKVKFIEDALQISRVTATKYLNTIVDAGLLKKEKYGNTNYYVNSKLIKIFTGIADYNTDNLININSTNINN